MTIAGGTQLGYISGGPPLIIVAGLEMFPFPIFTVDALPAGEAVTLDALTVTKGKAADCNTPGGGIVNRGQLTITRSVHHEQLRLCGERHR